ncbi:hypothetical protein SAMD00019534_099610 [Acytostelium subglobosum LB1]|uniref:hypothetical protein n=1 Tax=Acytostelium subglobosum LB1 TaxID=1410327 RepID=UPI0006449E29|nr:hypothetical protein SAMD00019534_099610 [Acytostelium subglobosum LB1]GAM26786.1 hypothetical protein SAMD00019534_099610 [Acytostelium subglobosum LB1]|eukprot:XP_012750447.1 hypothetical protein SAMD00019534_099610 [Acytostelium subglobosum LB1]
MPWLLEPSSPIPFTDDVQVDIDPTPTSSPFASTPTPGSPLPSPSPSPLSSPLILGSVHTSDVFTSGIPLASIDYYHPSTPPTTTTTTTTTTTLVDQMCPYQMSSPFQPQSPFMSPMSTTSMTSDTELSQPETPSSPYPVTPILAPTKKKKQVTSPYSPKSPASVASKELATAEQKCSRTLKSITEAFLDEYRTAEPEMYIDIGRMVDRLQVTKRRFYEIMNVMECFGVVRKEVRDTYFWLGFDNIGASIKAIQQLSQALASAGVPQPSVTAVAVDPYGTKVSSITTLCHQVVNLFLNRRVTSMVDVRESLHLCAKQAPCKRLLHHNFHGDAEHSLLDYLSL